MVLAQQYIDNEWRTGMGRPFHALNPATGEMIWEGNEATAEDVHQAVAAAARAGESWGALAVEQRMPYLETFQGVLEENRDALATTISQDTGKPLWEAKTEVSAMLGKLAISLEAFIDRSPERVRRLGDFTSITAHKPHGVVAIFGPFNFPAHLPNGHIIPALIAGNTLVFKPSELTPLTAEHIMRLWEEVSLPKGVLNMVQGGKMTGIDLAQHSDINGLFFTGSATTGKLLSEQFGAHPEKILALELGGNNPFVVWDVEDNEAAALLTIQSAYLTAGQRCTCARRLIIHDSSEGEKFLKTLIEMIPSVKVAPFTEDPEPFMGPVIDMTTAEKLLKKQEELKSEGGKILVEMKMLEKGKPFLSPGLIDMTGVPNLPDEELFGPLLKLHRVGSLSEAIAEANKTAYGLSSGILTRKREEFDLFYKKVRAGLINWNTQITGASGSAPFGGVGISGNFRPSAYYAADYCGYPVASMESETIKAPENLPPGIIMSNKS